MRFIGTLLLLCLVLAAAKAALVVLALAIMLTLLWGLFTRTAQTIGYIFVCAIFWFAGAHPKWMLAVIIAGAICIAVRWVIRLESDEPNQSDENL